MAGDDVTLTLLNEESAFLREKLKDLQIKYNSIIKTEAILENTVQGLQKQRNESEKNYNRLQKEHAVSCTAMVEKLKETEKKLQEINIKYETELTTETISLQKKIIILQDERNKTQKELIKGQKELIKAQREIINIQKELIKAEREIINTQKGMINLHKELYNHQEQLHQNADQIRIIQAEPKEREEKLMKSIDTQMITNQMVKMRIAYLRLSKRKYRTLTQITNRGELWYKYLKTNYENVTLPPNVKGCVRSLFDKLNKEVHNCYSIGDDMLIQKSAFDDVELTLLENLWQLSPLRKGSLSVREVID